MPDAVAGYVAAMLRRAAMRFHFWFVDHGPRLDRTVGRAGRFTVAVRELLRHLP